jgi:hypothetical protein
MVPQALRKFVWGQPGCKVCVLGLFLVHTLLDESRQVSGFFFTEFLEFVEGCVQAERK